MADTATETVTPALIWVTPHPSADKTLVAFWDRDDQQPGGEIMITGTQTQPVQVAQTSRVLKALDIKRLIQVEAPSERMAKSTAVAGADTAKGG